VVGGGGVESGGRAERRRMWSGAFRDHGVLWVFTLPAEEGRKQKLDVTDLSQYPQATWDCVLHCAEL
jgi:hypothetical protein